jgi:tRNA(Ile)-lysidine synthase
MREHGANRGLPNLHAHGTVWHLSPMSDSPPPVADSPSPDALLARVQAFVAAEGLWTPGLHLLVAVSGGPDSVALLDLLRRLAPIHALRLTVAHIDHTLRPESAEEARFVRALAQEWGLGVCVERVDVPARVRQTGESVEEAARALRYAALRGMAATVGADRIVTGHTADDQAETVLMRVLRGTGVAGLAGIPARRDAIVRPLLPLWRTDIEAYLTAHALPSRLDPSNASLAFTRNRLRHELLPTLEANYAPGVRARLVTLAGLARADDEALAGWASREYATRRQAHPEGVAIDLGADLPPAVRGRLWRMALAEVRGDLQGIGAAHLRELEALASGQVASLPGVQVIREAARLVITRGARDLPPLPLTPLPLPGEVVRLDLGWRLRAEPATRTGSWGGGDIAVLDADAVAEALAVRGWEPGDRYQPLGAPGRRSLQDLFVDAKVPRRYRARVPVVVDARGIVWLAGFRPAERVKVQPTTSRLWRLVIEWEWNPWTLQPSDTW